MSRKWGGIAAAEIRMFAQAAACMLLLAASTGCRDSSPPKDVLDERDLQSDMGETALVIPLLDSDGETLLSAQNEQLKAAGQAPVPDSIEFAAANVDEKIEEFKTVTLRYERTLIRREALLFAPALSTFQREEGPSLCYRGDPRKVAELAAHIRSGALSDLYEQIAWSTGSTTWIREELQRGHEEIERSLPIDWFTFDGARGDVLIVSGSAYSDDADDVTYVPRCALMGE